MDDSITFGQWVKQRRKALSLTQVELGRLVACSVIMVKKIESDERRPSVRVTKLLAGYLKIAPHERSRFIRLAHPNISPEQIEEIVSPYSPAVNQQPRRRVAGLRTPLTPLIGRSQEVANICSLLTSPNVRLVTLTGAGGIGKTRLGIQVANDLKEQFSHGCWFIPLAALTDFDLVIPTIARTLGIKESRDWALDESLLTYLADKDMLLVLDNFEQVIPAAAQVAEILMYAPGLKILITSRTILHILGEYEFIVPPLKLVDPSKSPSSQEVLDSPAVKLFMQRAQAVNINFSLTPENAATVAKICSRLDGLPLAIELAASRIKFLSPPVLLSRLESATPDDNPLNDLASSPRNLPARQQTMRHAIDWSYNLLSESEQDLFRYLAVFVGGCTLEAASAICGGDIVKSSPLLTPPIHVPLLFANRMTSLVDQSMLLLVKTPGEEPRFGMLEALHEYARERLTARPKEWTALKRLHARYFMTLAETAEPKLAGSEQEIWLDRLEMEHDNLLAALSWCINSPQEAEWGLKLMGASWQFWLVRGYVNEGRIWLQRFLETVQSAALDRARALNGAGFLNWMWGDFPQAKALLNESLLLFQELGDQHGTAWVLNHLGHVALAENEMDLAHDFVVKSLELFRKLGADSNIAWDLLNLGDIVEAQGNHARAGEHFAESQALFQKIGDRRGMAWAHDRLGQQAHAQHNYEEAIRFYRESISLFRKVGDKRSTAWVLNHLGKVALEMDHFEEAQHILEESLTLFREISWLLEGAWATFDMGDAAWALGSAERATFFFNKSLQLFHEVDNQRGAAEALERLERVSHIQGGRKSE